MSFAVPEQYRITVGALATLYGEVGNNGAFFLPNPHQRGGPPLKVIASDGLLIPGDMPELAGWEHVSVSLPHRCPTWEEMCYVKSRFWGPEDCVIQFHPPASEYVNLHPYCLHLWRPVSGDIRRPPRELVG